MERTCCCCISLQKGTIVIGIISLISAIMSGIKMKPLISNVELPYEFMTTEHNLGLFVFKIFLVTALIYIIVGGIFSVLMIVGAIRRIPGYIFPWLALSFGGFIYTVCTLLGAIVIIATIRPVGLFFAALIFSTTSTVVGFYMWKIVYNYHKELVEEKFQRQTYPNDEKNMVAPPSYYHI